MTINSWAQLFNTSCQPLKRLYVLLFDLGSYHVHVLLIRFFWESWSSSRGRQGQNSSFWWFSPPMLLYSYGVVFFCKWWATDLWAVVTFRKTWCDFCFSALYVLAMATIFKGPSFNGRGNTCSNKEQMYGPRLFIVSFYYRTFQRLFPDISLNCTLCTKYHKMYVLTQFRLVYCSGRPHCHSCLHVFIRNLKQERFWLLLFFFKV